MLGRIQVWISSHIPNRVVTAVSSVVLAAGVAVLVTVWASGWAWPAGVSLGVLVIIQCAVEWLRTSEDRPSADLVQKQSLNQKAGNISNSQIVGIRGRPANIGVDVQQTFGDVDRSTVVGIEFDTRDANERTLPQAEDDSGPQETGA